MSIIRIKSGKKSIISFINPENKCIKSNILNEKIYIFIEELKINEWGIYFSYYFSTKENEEFLFEKYFVFTDKKCFEEFKDSLKREIIIERDHIIKINADIIVNESSFESNYKELYDTFKLEKDSPKSIPSCQFQFLGIFFKKDEKDDLSIDSKLKYKKDFIFFQKGNINTNASELNNINTYQGSIDESILEDNQNSKEELNMENQGIEIKDSTTNEKEKAEEICKEETKKQDSMSDEEKLNALDNQEQKKFSDLTDTYNLGNKNNKEQSETKQEQSKRQRM